MIDPKTYCEDCGWNKPEDKVTDYGTNKITAILRSILADENNYTKLLQQAFALLYSTELLSILDDQNIVTGYLGNEVDHTGVYKK